MKAAIGSDSPHAINALRNVRVQRLSRLTAEPVEDIAEHDAALGLVAGAPPSALQLDQLRLDDVHDVDQSMLAEAPRTSERVEWGARNRAASKRRTTRFEYA